MATANQVREVHKLLDAWMRNKGLYEDEVQMVRSFLPELPKQKTLEEIAWDIDFARSETFGNDWKEELFGDLETWLSEQHTQLRAHLEGVKSQAHPALPAGMRLAKHENRGLVVATGWIDSDNEHFCVYRSDKLGHGTYAFLPESSLTFIDSEPAHPEFLETEGDYAAAPRGTVAAKDGWLSWLKETDGVWSCGGSSDRESVLVQSGKRRVLRWGWGN